MRLPVDTSKVTVIAGGPAERLVNFKTGELIFDKRTNQPVWVTNLVIFTPGEATPEVVKVKLFGDEPKPISQGLPVTVVGLVVSDWEIDGKHGLSFRADSITPLTGAGKAAA